MKTVKLIALALLLGNTTAFAKKLPLVNIKPRPKTIEVCQPLRGTVYATCRRNDQMKGLVRAKALESLPGHVLVSCLELKALLPRTICSPGLDPFGRLPLK